MGRRRHPFLDLPTPVAIAHPGGAEEAPENTIEAFSAAVAQGYRCIQVPIRAGRIRIVTAGFVRAAHRAGLPVHVWTVNDPATRHELLDLGVDGVMTDRPRVLREVLADRGVPSPAPRRL